MLEPDRHAPEVFFGEPDYGFVNVTEDGLFDGGVLDDFSENAAVAAADDEDAFGIRMNVHGEVGNHFLVAEKFLQVSGLVLRVLEVPLAEFGREKRTQTHPVQCIGSHCREQGQYRGLRTQRLGRLGIWIFRGEGSG